jgi:hypothetical protein
VSVAAPFAVKAVNWHGKMSQSTEKMAGGIAISENFVINVTAHE